MSFQLYFTITTESGLNSLKVIFTKQFLTKVTIFRCLDVCSVRPPQIFQVQAKNIHSTTVFPDYLSVSYGYALYHFYDLDVNELWTEYGAGQHERWLLYMNI